MQKSQLINSASISFAIFVILFAIGFYAFGWVEPVVAPPSGNVSAPINVSDTNQTKMGPLGIGASGHAVQWLKNISGKLYISNSSGTPTIVFTQDNKVGVGTTNPTEKLEVLGNIKASNVTVKGDSSISPSLNSDKLDSYHAADLMAQSGGGGGAITLWGQGSRGDGTVIAGTGAPNCPSGWTEAYTGYGPYFVVRDAFLEQNSQPGGVPSSYASYYVYGYATSVESCGTSKTLVSGTYSAAFGQTPFRLAQACNTTVVGGYYNEICNTCRVCVK